VEKRGAATEMIHAAGKFRRKLPAAFDLTRILALIKASIKISVGEIFPLGVPDGKV
jgi:hypothetical protein